jgi:DNA sulfur modification protein DndD
MIFERLTVCDFGVFRGQQEFDLSPRIKYGSHRPIVLFGGLNGSGKTSILTAIRLALHGRQALGFGTTQKKYESLLYRFFHREAHSHTTANETTVRLDFTYSNLGAATLYTVERRWQQTKKGIEEYFKVLANGVPVESSDPEQAQIFLTQLVPIGVSDLFFFDGEKIAELASEENGTMLADSIQRLLGLDVVLKLRADLDVYERRQGRQADLSAEQQTGFDALFQELEKNKSEVAIRYHKLRQELEPAISTVRIDLDKLEGRLAERGGAWSISRDAFGTKLEDLVQKKTLLESQLRELAAGLLPLALAPSLSKSLVNQLEIEREIGQITTVRQTLEIKRTKLREKLNAVGVTANVDNVINAVVGVLGENSRTKSTSKHCLGESDREKLISSFSHLLPTDIKAAEAISKELIGIDEELAFVSGRISAAPSEEQLKGDFEMVKSANQTMGDLLAQKRLLLEEVKTLIWRQIELVRRLKKDFSQSVKHDSKKEIKSRVSAIKNTLDSFSERLVARKTALLAEHFMTSFRQLIRKESLVSSVTVDPKTLVLTLRGSDNEEIQKTQLSAGERQLFAVAMLDALAKTSGRSIPIIIDTPLGRLDSHHRSNLIRNYLPHASHQVVVLSTDTEVDERFFHELSPSVSHAYHLDFDDVARATVAREGYFWRHRNEGSKHVA